MGWMKIRNIDAIVYVNFNIDSHNFNINSKAKISSSFVSHCVPSNHYVLQPWLPWSHHDNHGHTIITMFTNTLDVFLPWLSVHVQAGIYCILIVLLSIIHGSLNISAQYIMPSLYLSQKYIGNVAYFSLHACTYVYSGPSVFYPDWHLFMRHMFYGLHN